MAKSKVDKNRKSNVQEFKANQKSKNKNMSQEQTSEVPQMKPIQQIPIWKDDETFEITGAQFRALNDFMNVFAQPLGILRQVFESNLNAGKIEMKYQDLEGNEVSREEVEAMIEEYKNFVLKQSQENPPSETEIAPE